MEENSEKKLKQERARRIRVARIRHSIISVFGVWLVLSVAICVFLLLKLHTMEEKMDYLLDNFTVSGQMEEESKNSAADTDAGAYLNLEGMEESYDAQEDYVVAQAVNQRENLAGPDDLHKVYLTFDDGPSSNTAQILDILKKHDLKATFFVVGREGEEEKALYRRIVEEGHTLAMHSYSHRYNALYQSREAFEQDFAQIQNYLYEITGQECLFYRFPGGSSNHVSNTDMTEFIRYLNSQGITYF